VFLQRFGPLLLLGILFYFLVFGTKRKEAKKREDMLGQLKKGDEVVTIGGQVGKVIEVRSDRVQLKVDESSNTKIWFLRSAIHRVLEDDKADNK
jgi:preprotein translocase subunit YajC